MYPGIVSNLAIENGMLIVANRTGDVQTFLGENGSVSNLDAWTFTNSGGVLTGNHAWTISTGAQWAPWTALEKLPNGTVAAAWTNSALGSGNATNGNEMIVTIATGATDWSVATTGYPRYLRFDSSRNQVVAIEEADPSTTYSYSIVARHLLNGDLANSVTEDSATALNFQVGDLDGDGLNEWVTTDLGYLPCTPVACVGLQNSSRVLAVNGTTGAMEWSQVRNGDVINPNDPLTGNPSPRAYGLLLTSKANGADVLVGSFLGNNQIELERLSGSLSLSGPGGTVLWAQSSPNAFLPLFLSLYQQGGTQFVRAASSRNRLYGMTSGIGSVADAGTDPNDPHNYVVHLTGVSNAQYITVSLTNVADSVGNFSSIVSAQMGVLIGDVNASGVVTSGDTNLCKAQALQPVTASDFRNDINASGAITTGDVNLIKQHALEQLPP